MDDEYKNSDKKNIEKETADIDAWGYVVCFGIIITFIASIGHVNSFGLIYNDFIIDTHSTAKSLTSAHGVFAIMLAVGGILLNMAIKSISLRSGGIIGAVLFTVGSLITIPISNTNQLPYTFGVLQGIGFGMMVPVCYATLNHYFVKKRTTVMSICKALQGVISMGYPLLLKILMSTYGFRGTLLIISGISLHTFAGMLTMKTNKKCIRINRTANNIELEKGENEVNKLLNPNENIQVTKAGEKYIDNQKSNKIGSQLLEILNVRVLKDPVYCNICIGQSFVNFSDLTFFILQPMLLFQYGYDNTQVATCISISTGADVVGRCILAFMSTFISINTRLLFYIATLCTLVIRIVVLQVREFVWVALVTCIMGMLRAWLHVASPLVISNYVSHKDFPGAYAVFMLSAGLINVSLSPLIGLLKDVYQDYVPAFYALTLCCIPCLLFWPVEYTFKSK